MPPPELDLRLDAFEPADEQTEEAFWHAIEVEQDMLTTLAEHHSADGTDSYYVLHNAAATWGVPGEPQVVALHLRRDLATKTFRFDHATLPLPAMAQSWLTARGCPKESIRLPSGTGTAPADEATRTLEERLLSDGDHFALLTSYTRDGPHDMGTTVFPRALDERTPAPFRVLHEEVDTEAWTHTLREGGFATFADAVAWWEKRSTGHPVPLPPVQPVTRRGQPPAAAMPTQPGQRPRVFEK